MAPDPMVLPRRPRARAGAQHAGRWWGRAWLRTCEELALDPADLRAGRTLARSGRFGAVVAIAGMASSVLDQRSEHPLMVQVKVAALDDRAWATFVTELARRSGHLAALEAGELPDDLVTGADELGVELLPGPAEVETACECDAWTQPCQHALGLATLLAWSMDTDPYVLLLLRGRTREALLDAVAEQLDTAGPAAAVEDAANRASRILRLAGDAPAGHGLADSAVAAYDEEVSRLL
jgi:uncharacterized Zn finger protein